VFHSVFFWIYYLKNIIEIIQLLTS